MPTPPPATLSREQSKAPSHCLAYFRLLARFSLHLGGDHLILVPSEQLVYTPLLSNPSEKKYKSV
uniref:Uncharacterized protein n=1 Tax=Aegilops tauschii subsp. strangulata TaxID=200361 RepID=A0A453GXI9_AEGTS